MENLELKRLQEKHPDAVIHKLHGYLRDDGDGLGDEVEWDALTPEKSLRDWWLRDARKEIPKSKFTPVTVYAVAVKEQQ